jgi:hypothetical protein
MADITKCVNRECEVKERCYRWMAIDSGSRQSRQSFDCGKHNNYADMKEI